MREGLAQRWPDLRVTVVHATVQGATAPADLERAIGVALGGRPDVLVVARGGGSAEDLAAFDDPRVVQAVLAASAAGVVTVSAIGHETDHSLCDLVADVRAKTPTYAIECAVPDAAVLRRALARARTDLASATRAALAAHATARADAAAGLRAGVARSLAASRERAAQVRQGLARAPRSGAPRTRAGPRAPPRPAAAADHAPAHRQADAPRGARARPARGHAAGARGARADVRAPPGDAAGPRPAPHPRARVCARARVRR